MKLSALFALISAFQIAVAAAPAVGPVAQTSESLFNITSFIAQSPFEDNRQTMTATITAYSSTPDQTDDTPCITASGYDVCENPYNRNVVAANFVPIGTKMQIPALFGDKVFTVEDRMHERFNDRIDVWFPDRSSAKKFGKQSEVTVIVFEG
ncbi:MAG: hypothetical protein AAB407_00835 [Patescibacteria group bacterium]